MDIPQLNAFLAVAQHGSFSAAANTLGLTQPAVSKRIAGLEAQLNTRLFDRIARRVQLTEAGVRLQDETLEIMQRLRQLPSICLLYTSPSPRDQRGSRMPSSA